MLKSHMFLNALWISLFPGPTTLISASLGKKYGFWKSFKFIQGAIVGFVALGMLASFGRFYLLSGFEQFTQLLKCCGCIYILIAALFIMIDFQLSWLEDYNLSFSAGLILNWVNPFSFAPIFTEFSKHLHSNVEGIIFILTQLWIGFFALTVWACLGGYISKRLRSFRYSRILDFFVGSVLIAQVTYILLYK